jgi:hypothetical protein
MSAKKHTVKKSARTKKMLHDLAHSIEPQPHHEEKASQQSMDAGEEAIRKQFLLIQMEYSRLMTEVSKEFGLVKDWIEKEAREKGTELMAKIPTNISSKIPVNFLK